MNGSVARAASKVRAGDRVEARVEGRERVLEVLRPIYKRVGATEAVACVVDHSPPAPARPEAVFARDPGAGRPTKRHRRELDRLRR